MRPPVPYFGGKISTGPEIGDLLPSHRHYVEPYCGSLAVLSGYASDLYDRELYVGWDRHTIAAGTGQGPNGWTNRTEVIWSNRPLGRQRHLFDESV